MDLYSEVTTTEALQAGTVLDCGHVLTEEMRHSIGTHSAGVPLGTGYARTGTGYARTANDFTMCYPCANEYDRSAMANANEHIAYLSANGKLITTWTGGVLAKVTQHGAARNGFHGSMIHAVRAVAPDGSEWYGRNGGEGMAIKIKRAKTSR